MNALVRLAFRNTLRRRARTMLTAGMVLFGVALLLIALTWMRGAFGSMLSAAAALNGHVRIVDPDFARREELRPLDENLEDVGRWIDLLSRQPGVTGVEPRLSVGVTVTAGEEIGEVFGVAIGASERYFRERTNAKDKLVAGTWFSGASDEIIVGAKIAEQTKAKIGDELLLLGTTQYGSLSPIEGRLVGIVKTGGGALDQTIFVPLPRMQYLADMEDAATELLVYGRTHEDAPQLEDQLRTVAELASYEVETYAEREPWKSMSGTARSMQWIMVFVVVFLTALGIWNTMMMSVLERTHEIGVLRAMGLSRLGAVGMLVQEALAIGLLGGLLGIAAGAYPAWLLDSKGLRIGEETASNLTYAMSETIHGDLTTGTAAIAFGLGLVTAVLGSVVPALRAASIQPVSAMRSGR